MAARIQSRTCLAWPGSASTIRHPGPRHPPMITDVLSAGQRPTGPTLNHAKSKTIDVTSVQVLTTMDKIKDDLLRWQGDSGTLATGTAVREGSGGRDSAGREPDRAAHDPGQAAAGAAGKGR